MPDLSDLVPFIQDKLKISVYLSLDKCKICIKFIKFRISYFDQLLWVHMLHWKQCGSWSAGFFRSQLIWIYTVYKKVDICMVSYCFRKCKLFKHRKVYIHYHNSNLIWRTVSRRVDEVIPSDHPRHVAPRMIQWYGLILETWYCMPDQVTIMIICLFYAFFCHSFWF